MRVLQLLTGLLLLSVNASMAAPGSKQLLSEIDALCRCTGMQRKSDIQSNDGAIAELLLAADGVAEKYWIRLTDDHPSGFGPDNYTVRWELPRVKNAARRRTCISIVERLNKCKFSWQRYGKPEVVVDAPRGFRVRYASMPEKKGEVAFSTVGSLYFLITPKGTVCGIFYSE
jgi:hypothetical protein